MKKVEIIKDWEHKFEISITYNGYQWNTILRKLSLEEAKKTKDFLCRELGFAWLKPEDDTYLIEES